MNRYTILSLLFVGIAFNVAKHNNQDFMMSESPSAQEAVAYGDTIALDGVVLKVIDGDSFRVDHTEVRLWGVDAPEFNTPGFNAAKTGLRKRIEGRFIQCTVLDIDRFQRSVARCQFDDGGDKKDLGLSLLQAGFVREYCRYSNNYYGYCDKQAKQGD